MITKAIEKSTGKRVTLIQVERAELDKIEQALRGYGYNNLWFDPVINEIIIGTSATGGEFASEGDWIVVWSRRKIQTYFERETDIVQSRFSIP